MVIKTLASWALSQLGSAVENTAKEYNPETKNGQGIKGLGITSYADLAKLTQIEVPTAVDEALTMHDSTTDVLKWINGLYTGMVISSAGLMSDTGSIKTAAFMSKLNPARSPTYNLAQGILSGNFSGESLSVSEEALSELNKLPTTLDYGIETNQPKTAQQIADEKEQRRKEELERKNTRNPTFRDSNNLTTVANLAAGQAVTISLSDGKASRDIQITVRMIPIPVSQTSLRSILTWGGRDLSMRSRISAYRAGELEGWRDLILFRDIFAERTRLRMEDKSGLLKTLLDRQTKSTVSSLMSATPSFGTISAVMVIADDTLAEIERRSDFDLSKFKDRQRIMNSTGLMFIAVVDPMSELVTLYTYGNAMAGEYSIKQLKSSKGSNDLTDIVKLLSLSKNPSF